MDRVVDSYAQESDYWAPLLSLPRIFGTSASTIPGNVPYLSADPARVNQWRNDLNKTSSFKIGIAWQGNPDYSGDHLRSIPLTHFTALAEIPNVQLVSLQKGHGHEQLLALGEETKIVDMGAQLDEGPQKFVDTAAVMMNLDMVISSDTAIAHLAGALGVPTWVALQHVPNWRWLLDREDSPWYPTMRLFRQTTHGDWQGVFRRIASALETVSATT